LSSTLREEHRLRVSENRVLRRIFGPQKDDGIGIWRKMRNEEFLNFYSSPSIKRLIKSRRIRWTGYVVRLGRSAHIVLMGKPEGKRPL
jgi:hypothetical protein